MRWLRKLLERLPPGPAVLDLGGGSGSPADVQIAKFHLVTGVDISQTQIELARKNVPAGRFIHDDLGSVEFPAASFNAVISFYTLEHLPRDNHATILRRIHQWLKKDEFILISTEAAEFEGGIGIWLGVPMFFSNFHPEKLKQLVEEVGFEFIETEVETQLEGGVEIPYLWMLAQKR